MGVHNKGGHPITGSEDYTGGFATHPRKGRKLFQGGGDLSPMVGDDFLGKGCQVSSLGVIKPRRSNKILQF